jgi:hypothetical protein
MKNKIVKEFMATTKIPETPNKTLEAMMDFLTEETSVNRMLVATELGLPALTGVVKELETRFAHSDFPLHYDGPHRNSANRRNVGWMVKYIMREYGYVPVEYGESRIGAFADAQYFKTSTRYEKSDKRGNYRLVPVIIAETKD